MFMFDGLDDDDDEKKERITCCFSFVLCYAQDFTSSFYWKKQ